MKNLFDGTSAAEITSRLDRLGPDAQRVWGTMTAAQAMAHCANGLEMVLGEKRPPRLLAGRIFGAFVKRLVLRDEKPFKRNSPTDPILVIGDQRDLAAEKARLAALIQRLVAGGTSAVTTHPHSFFGRLTANEWGVLTYKHLDHHLRQFGV